MKEFKFRGFIIFIGNNKHENAFLLNKADPHDFWIHIKDYSSGHVIIKNPTGKKIPKPIIKKACCLLKSNTNKCKSIENLEFCIAKRESIILTEHPGEVLLNDSKFIKV